MIKETLEILESSFNDEFNLWEKTAGKDTLPKIDSFLNAVTKNNILLFNTVSTMDNIKSLLIKDEDTQQAVLMFLLRVKYRFISYGGEWDSLVETLNEVGESINKDNTFNTKLEGFEQTVKIDNNNMVQALLYYYILSPNLIIARGYNVTEEK